MRILQIIDGLGIGGAEKLILDTAPEFSKKGHISDVLLLNGEKTSFYNELESSGCCRIFSLGTSFYNPFYVFKIIPYLKNYDIVHVHLFPAQYFAVLAKILAFSKVKFVFTEHNTDNKRINNPKFKKIEQWIYSHYDRLICITDEVKIILREKLNIPEENLLTIYNGINISKIQAAIKYNKHAMGFADSDKIISTVAGFRFQKDQDTVIKTLMLLPPHYKLLLVGDGIRRKELEQLVKECDLTDRVHFLGIRTDVYSLIKMSDIAILSSHWEGFGLAAAESMACGVPTIASNVSGLSNVVKGGGLLFEKGDIDSLKNVILSLEDEGFYNLVKKKGMIKSSQYDINKMVDKIILVYKSLTCLK